MVFGIGDWDWGLTFGDRDWDWVLGIGIVKWDKGSRMRIWELGLEMGIEKWVRYWGSGWRIGMEIGIDIRGLSQYRIFGPSTHPPPSKSDKTPYSYMNIRNYHREVRLGGWGLRARHECACATIQCVRYYLSFVRL